MKYIFFLISFLSLKQIRRNVEINIEIYLFFHKTNHSKKCFAYFRDEWKRINMIEKKEKH